MFVLQSVYRQYWQRNIQSAVRSIVFLPHSQWIVTSSDDHSVRVWDIQSGVCQLTLQGNMGLWGVDASQTPDFLVTTGNDNHVRLWRYEVLWTDNAAYFRPIVINSASAQAQDQSVILALSGYYGHFASAQVILVNQAYLFMSGPFLHFSWVNACSSILVLFNLKRLQFEALPGQFVPHIFFLEATKWPMNKSVRLSAKPWAKDISKLFQGNDYVYRMNFQGSDQISKANIFPHPHTQIYCLILRRYGGLKRFNDHSYSVHKVRVQLVEKRTSCLQHHDRLSRVEMSFFWVSCLPEPSSQRHR